MTKPTKRHLVQLVLAYDRNDFDTYKANHCREPGLVARCVRSVEMLAEYTCDEAEVVELTDWEQGKLAPHALVIRRTIAARGFAVSYGMGRG
jgi:hypothetical protein